MLVYSTAISPRLQYITKLAGEAICGDEWNVTSDLDEYLRYPGPRINYSTARQPNDLLFIYPHGLLHETGVRVIDATVFTTNEYPILFPTDGDLPFDVFAASFWLLTRYEEYLPHEKDMYGRYAHQNSLAWREGFLDKPVVNRWFNELASGLALRMPGIALKKKEFTFRPTYDIDIAWSYLNKGIMRNLLGSIKDIVTLKPIRLGIRWRVLAFDLPDPYDAYEWMDQLHSELQVAPVYFFLVARDRGKYDYNISPTKPALRTLIKGHSLKYETGVHPSWKSGDQPGYVGYEKSLIEAVTGKKVIHSRQHYIRMDLPKTYRTLIDAGILHDYSMGYGSINGFRASYSSPYRWYDLDREEATNLTLHPFCYMEANSYYEQKYTPDQALTEMRHYAAQLRDTGGTMITIWHNHFLGTEPVFAEWKRIYEVFLREMSGG